MSATMLPRPEQLVDLVGTVAAVKLSMDGAFDERIGELKAARAALEETQTSVKTLGEAQKVRDDADAYATQTRSAIETLLAKARETSDKAASREVTLSARESAVASRESGVDARQQTQDKREQAMLDAQSAGDADLSSREAVLKKNEAIYAARAKQLASDIAAFNQRLEALKA